MRTHFNKSLISVPLWSSSPWTPNNNASGGIIFFISVHLYIVRLVLKALRDIFIVAGYGWRHAGGHADTIGGRGRGCTLFPILLTGLPSSRITFSCTNGLIGPRRTHREKSRHFTRLCWGRDTGRETDHSRMKHTQTHRDDEMHGQKCMFYFSFQIPTI